MNDDLQGNSEDERLSRIVTASLEVFAEFSFEDATTGEIARRARVSKRDIYVYFPNKHALLIGTMNEVLHAENVKIIQTIERTSGLPSLRHRLVAIGLRLIDEVLSIAMSVMTRLAASESIRQPLIGTVFFENGISRRNKLVSEVLSTYIATPDTMAVVIFQAAEHFIALVTHRPRLTALVGMRDIWDPGAIQAHAEAAVDCFLRAHPIFASKVIHAEGELARQGREIGS
jgi:AcrR family transcriptional regulator